MEGRLCPESAAQVEEKTLSLEVLQVEEDLPWEQPAVAFSDSPHLHLSSRP